MSGDGLSRKPGFRGRLKTKFLIYMIVDLDFSRLLAGQAGWKPAPQKIFLKNQWGVFRQSLRSGRLHNSAGLLYHKVQQLMAQVFAETPLGACMVSSEGACAAYYRYGRYQEAA
jgi:hypothetical protein